MELQWLQQKGIIFELTIQEEINANLSDLRSEHNIAKTLLNRALEIADTDLKQIKDEARRIELMKEQHFTILRLMAIIMEAKKGFRQSQHFHTQNTTTIQKSQTKAM